MCLLFQMIRVGKKCSFVAFNFYRTMRQAFALILATALVFQCGLPAANAHLMHMLGGGGGSSGILELLAAGFIAKLLSEDHHPTYHYPMPMPMHYPMRMHYPMPMYMMMNHYDKYWIGTNRVGYVSYKTSGHEQSILVAQMRRS